ncbi:type II secretion system protein [Thermotoga sp. RQ2]|uniref:type II secretion system protein n=1 Tax=Thermotoga sp. (strain RQ2) TaxID=126740 RepID=UPI001EE4EFBE|nr:type II secretion system protein [Thermotoga sp. RQ2]
MKSGYTLVEILVSFIVLMIVLGTFFIVSMYSIRTLNIVKDFKNSEYRERLWRIFLPFEYDEKQDHKPASVRIGCHSSGHLPITEQQSVCSVQGRKNTDPRVF